MSSAMSKLHDIATWQRNVPLTEMSPQNLSSRPERPGFFLHAPVVTSNNDACRVALWRDRG